MARILIAGDGPAGLSAALFLAKNGHEALVYGEDDTGVHYAQLRNYLGVRDEPGPEFMQRARRHVADHGAALNEGEIDEIVRAGEGFTATTAAGEEVASDYVILAAGKAGGSLARGLGLEAGPDGVDVDSEYRTGADRVYAIGRLARPNRSQVVISAGAGGVAALDILAAEQGEDVTDWDDLET